MNPHHQEFESYFLQTFLSNKIKINIKDSENQRYFFDLSKSFQMSGYLLKSIDFSENTLALKDKLIKLNDNYLKKILLMRSEVSKIAELFDKNGIGYVVLKGMAIKIKKIDPCRQFRDLDILIKQKDLKKAYKLLRASGYAYFNSCANDSVKYIRDMHHIPPMVNDARIIIELHCRITKASIYKSCPLTEHAFSEREIYDGISVPSDRVMLAHILYHGILHHELKFGPYFLLDAKNVLLKNSDTNKSIINLLKKMGLSDFYEEVKLLLEKCKNKKHIDSMLLNEFRSLFNGKDLFSTKADDQNNKKSISRLIKYIKYNSYYYQLPYSSPKLIFLILKKLLKKIHY